MLTWHNYKTSSLLFSVEYFFFPYRVWYRHSEWKAKRVKKEDELSVKRGLGFSSQNAEIGLYLISLSSAPSRIQEIIAIVIRTWRLLWFVSGRRTRRRFRKAKSCSCGVERVRGVSRSQSWWPLSSIQPRNHQFFHLIFLLSQKLFKKIMMHRLIAGSVFVGKMRMQGEGSRTFCCSSETEPSECNCFQIFGSLLLREGEGQGSQMLPEGCLPQPRRFSKRRCTLWHVGPDWKGDPGALSLHWSLSKITQSLLGFQETGLHSPPP